MGDVYRIPDNSFLCHDGKSRHQSPQMFAVAGPAGLCKPITTAMLKFVANVRPSRELVERIASVSPENPFYTANYTHVRELLGELPCIFMLEKAGTVVCGCTGFLRGRYFNRTLEVASTPSLTDPEIFWDGLKQFCSDHGVWDLHVESFASRTVSVPNFKNSLARRQRYEFLLDLRADNPLDGMSTNHRRNINRARKAGVFIRRTNDPLACVTHMELLKASVQRRLGQMEKLSLLPEKTFASAVLKSNVGELFQVVRGETVLSSVLLLKAASGAYYQSAGTSLEGTTVGASTFLVTEMIKILKRDGFHVLNLGGASPGSAGLVRFKEGFGGCKIMLESASFSMATPFLRKLRMLATTAKELSSSVTRKCV